MRIYFYIFVLYIIIPYNEILPQDSLNNGNSFSIYTESELASRYLFRGISLHDNFVYQPAVYCWYGNPMKWGMLGAGLWLNSDLPYKYEEAIEQNESGGNNKSVIQYEPFRFTEADFYLMHEFCFDKFTVRNTFAIYTFSGITGYPNTTEYFFNFSYTLHDIFFSAEAACDISAYPGSFVFTSLIGYEKKLKKDFYALASVDLIWAGKKYNNVNFGVNKNDFNSAGIEISLSYQPDIGFYSKIRWQYNYYLSKDIRNTYYEHNSFFGLITGYSF